MVKQILWVLGLVCTTALTAQDNVFLERGFWKNNPTIAQVEEAIAAGNDATELNRNMFDGVCYALLEQADNATIKHLIGKKGNAVDKITHDGRTYIFWAAYKGNLDMVQWLVAQGARADIEDAHGYSVLNFAANAGQTNTKLYDFLLQHKADIHATTRSGANALLLMASAAKDMQSLDYFVAKCLALNSVDDAGNGVFNYAARSGNISLLKALAAKGVAVDLVNTRGENAMVMAAQGSRRHQNGKEVFAYLESLGLKANLVTKEGKNLLHLIAYRNKDIALYQYLIKKGVAAGQADKEGVTPLMNASRANDLEIVQLLAKAGKKVNQQDDKGRSALAMAIARNQAEVVEFLLEEGAKVKQKDNKGNTLAHYLTQSFDARDQEDFNAKLKLLTAAGLKLDTKQAAGNTLLHLAAQDGDFALLKRLKAYGIAINAKNNEGNTALHLAALSAANTEIMEYLIAEGADLGLTTDFEETAYDLAKENEILQKKGVNLEFLKL